MTMIWYDLLPHQLSNANVGIVKPIILNVCFSDQHVVHIIIKYASQANVHECVPISGNQYTPSEQREDNPNHKVGDSKLRIFSRHHLGLALSPTSPLGSAGCHRSNLDVVRNLSGLAVLWYRFLLFGT